jgi:hypothetical protein
MDLVKRPRNDFKGSKAPICTPETSERANNSLDSLDSLDLNDVNITETPKPKSSFNFKLMLDLSKVDVNSDPESSLSY